MNSSTLAAKHRIDPLDRANMDRGTLSPTEQDYDKVVSQMYREKHADYKRTTEPLIKQLEEESNSDKAHEVAQTRADSLLGRVTAVADRNRSYSMDSALPSMKAAGDRRMQRQSAAASTGMVTQGAMESRQRRMSARNQLMGVGEQLMSSGIATMSSVAQQQQQRNQAYDQAKSGFMSQVFAIGGAAIGSFAGPMGASLGASIGGSIGGAVGG